MSTSDDELRALIAADIAPTIRLAASMPTPTLAERDQRAQLLIDDLATRAVQVVRGAGR